MKQHFSEWSKLENLFKTVVQEEDSDSITVSRNNEKTKNLKPPKARFVRRTSFNESAHVFEMSRRNENREMTSRKSVGPEIVTDLSMLPIPQELRSPLSLTPNEKRRPLMERDSSINNNNNPLSKNSNSAKILKRKLPLKPGSMTVNEETLKFQVCGITGKDLYEIYKKKTEVSKWYEF